MGDGIENQHKRRAYERISISHVNNIHFKYANSTYNTAYIQALGTFESGDKRATGQRGNLKSMHVHTVH